MATGAKQGVGDSKEWQGAGQLEYACTNGLKGHQPSPPADCCPRMMAHYYQIFLFS